MTRTGEPVLECATCRKPVPGRARYRPFCSARCKMVDLGRWFHEEYFVPGEPAVGFMEEGGLDERDA